MSFLDAFKKAKSSFHVSIPKSISESIGSLPKKNSELRLGKDVEEHIEDYKINEEFLKGVPILNAAIDKTVDFVVGTGFHVVSTERRAVDAIEDFMRSMDFDNYLRKIVRHLLVYGNCYTEIVKTGNKVTDLKVWSPKYMYIVRDDNAEVKGYVQIFNNSQSRNEFDKEDIIHFSFNNVGDDAYGTSIIKSLITTLTRKLELEKTMSDNAKYRPKTVVKIGSEDQPAQQSDIDAVATDLGVKGKDELFVANHLFNMDVVNYANSLVDVMNYSSHFESNAIYGLQVPLFLLGAPEGSNRSTAEEQLVAFQRRIKSIQFAIESILERSLFQAVLLTKRIRKVWVEFEWGMSEFEKKTFLNVAPRLLKNDMVISETVRLALNKKLIRLLDLKIPPDEVEKMELPIIPVKQPDQGNPANTNNKPNKQAEFFVSYDMYKKLLDKLS